ncbi:MAG: M4 family metallopeptidase [Bacteroidota bacterium]|nr:M4 family metallopeptidase [Bacteroidota bacterium]
MKRILVLVVACFFISSLVLAQTYRGEEANNIVKGSNTVKIDEQGSIQFIRLNKVVSENNHLKWLKNSLDLKQNEDLIFYKKENDQYEFSHYRYKQYYNNLEVEFGVYYAHIKNNRLISANGTFFKDININTTPSITEENAFNTAMNSLLPNAKIREDTKQEYFKHSNPKLIIFSSKNNYYLAYKFDIYLPAQIIRNDVYVDAHSGELIEKINKIHRANAQGTAITMYNGTQTITTDSLGTYYALSETGRGYGIETLDMNKGTIYQNADPFTNTTNYWDDTTNQDHIALDVHFGAESTFDYFYNTFNRSSFSGFGSKIFNYVHYGTNLAFAMWDGLRFAFGDGDNTYNPYTSLNLYAHEFTHAIIEYTANLSYTGETGALQESFCDIFGICVDQYINPTTFNYSFGEQVTKTSQPLRNFVSPKTLNHPDTYLGQYWHSGFGGENINSNIQNHWFFLLAEGTSGVNDNGDTFNITGIGIVDASKITYRCLTNYLTPISDYDDARFYSIQSAIDIFGNCSQQVTSTTDAWYAVGIGKGFQFDTLKAKFVVPLRYFCKPPSSVPFINQSTNASNYLWDFGDGDTSYSVNPTHIYQDSGYYTISLSVWDTSYLCSQNDTETYVLYSHIYIQDSANVDFLVSNDSVSAGCDLITLTDISDSCVQNWNWIISPSTYTVMSPSANFPTIDVRLDDTGTYSIKLVVDFGITSDSIIKTNYLHTDFLAGFDFDATNKNPIVGKDTVVLLDTSQCSYSRNWLISPNTYTVVPSSNIKGIKVVFNNVGNYNISMVTSYGSYIDTVVKNNYIKVISYCTPVVINLNPDIGISNFTMGNINNNTVIGNYAYTYYPLINNRGYNLLDSIPFSLSRNSTNNNMNRKVWVDWNIDGDFDDQGELVSYEPSATTNTFHDTIVVPATATFGTTTLRIGTSILGMSNKACGANMYGEFEDYRLKITLADFIEIYLKGQDVINIEQCSNYIDAGYTYTSIAPITSFDTITNLDISTTGTYYYKYKLTDSLNNTKTIKRIINVFPKIDLSTEFALLGNEHDTVSIYTTYFDPGYQTNMTCNVIDSVVIIGSVDTSKLGVYTLNYYAYSPNNFIVRTRFVHVVDNVDPLISLNGSSYISVEVNSSFTDPGVTVSDNYCDSSSITVVVVGSVDTSKIAEYTLNYLATDCKGNGPVTVSRIVKVEDTQAPQITSALYNDKDTIDVEVFNKLILPIFTIADNYSTVFDIDTSGSFVSTFPDLISNNLGTYNIIISVTDSSLNTATFELIVKVVDTEAPVITLYGSSVLNIFRFDTIKVDSFSVSDNYDKNVVVIRGGDYITDYLVYFKTGFYTLKYDAVDQSGNNAMQEKRFINVEKGGSIDNENALKGFKVYPNPTNGKLTIEKSIKALEIQNIEVYNSIGENIQSIQFINNQEKTEINLEGCGKGLYFIRIFTLKDNYEFKIIYR